ncbi:hypothetical protein H0H92_004751 [Tricholoma furcatifolium]|nr:hypothetical protein H0H92_004751 [Tricholoma furcatifolium]
MAFQETSFDLRCSTALRDNANHFSDSEVVLGRGLRASIEQKLSAINDQIAQLVAKREPYAKSLANLKIALAPHRRLPSELLARIFILAVTGETYTIPPWGTGGIPNRLPWILGQVCSKWRQIVSAEPRLWNKVELISSHRYTKPTDMERANEFIPHGVVSWKIDESSAPPGHFLLKLEEFSLSRLRHLSIELEFPYLVEALAALPPSLASLESIHLMSSYDKLPKPNDIDGLKSTKLFQIARDLRRISFTVLGYYIAKQAGEAFQDIPDIPWGQLSYLSLSTDISTPSDLDRLYSVFKKCTSLQQLGCTIDYMANLTIVPREASDDPIVPPQLQRLEINASYASKFAFPWAQFSQLTLVDVGSTCLKKIISKSRGLESLVVLGRGGEPRMPDEIKMSASPIVLDSLVSLVLSEGYIEVLQYICPPQLVDLRIERGGRYSIRRITAFIEHRDLHLTSFHHNASLRAEDGPSTLRQFLCALNSLRVWRTKHLLIQDELLLEIGQGLLLPRIEEMEIRVQPTIVFASAIKTRLEIASRSNLVLLRLAHGHYPASCVDNGDTAPNIAHSIRTFTDLNALYGTSFKLQSY